MTSELKVDKITPASGTNTQIGEAGDTTNLSAGTVTLPTSIITGASEKTTLVDADKFLIADSADSNAFKHVQKSNLPGGTHVLLNSSNATGLSDITFDNFSSTYNKYRILGSHSMGTNNAQTRFRMRKSGSDQTGSNYRYAYVTVYKNSSGTAAVGENTAWNADHVRLTGGSSYTAAHRTVSDIVVYSPAHATYQTFMNIDVAYYYPGGDAVFRWSGMCWVDSSSGTSNTGIKFYPESGTIDNARWEIYGIVDS